MDPNNSVIKKLWCIRLVSWNRMGGEVGSGYDLQEIPISASNWPHITDIILTFKEQQMTFF